MGNKDIVEKTLESYNDVFVDIVNVLLFNGERVVNENELEDAVLRYHYKADNTKLHEMERDAAKYWKQNNIRIAFFGNENQTEADIDAPIRGAGYDGIEYRRQMLADYEEVINQETNQKKIIKKRKQRFPVITLFLYFGYKKHWSQPRTLHECLNVSERLKPYINDYKINLFEIAYLSDEQVKMFQSDFRIVADFFVQIRKNNNYIPSKETIKHVHEVLEFMSVITGDHRYEDSWNNFHKEGSVTMCEFLDRIVMESEARGEARGIINFALELGYSSDEVISTLQKKLKIKTEQAEEYLKRFYEGKL